MRLYPSVSREGVGGQGTTVDASAMKLMFESLDDLLEELRSRGIEFVRVYVATHRDGSRLPSAVPHLTNRIVVTAELGPTLWAEWRYCRPEPRGGR